MHPKFYPSIFRFCAVFLILFSFTSPLKAETATEEKDAFDIGLEEAVKLSIKGPATIPLNEFGTLNLPANYIYVPTKPAADYMMLIGNEVTSEFVGFISPADSPEDWFITIDYIDSGYIKDGDAKNWNHRKLLNEIKDGTAEGNKYRNEIGVVPIEILGWIEKPNYNPKNHQLTYSISIQDIGAEAELPKTINLNTYILGRSGYFQMGLVTDDRYIEEDKDHAYKANAAVSFNDGKAYEDYQDGDRVSDQGLDSLITGLIGDKEAVVEETVESAKDSFPHIWKLIGLIVLGVAISALVVSFKRNQKTL